MNTLTSSSSLTSNGNAYSSVRKLFTTKDFWGKNPSKTLAVFFTEILKIIFFPNKQITRDFLGRKLIYNCI